VAEAVRSYDLTTSKIENSIDDARQGMENGPYTRHEAENGRVSSTDAPR
jgi:hypothetical protein